MKVKSEREVTESCPNLSDPVDRSLPGSSVHGIFQARVLEWGAIAFSSSFFYCLLIILACMQALGLQLELTSLCINEPYLLVVLLTMCQI